LQSILDDCGPEAAFCVLDDYERLSPSMISRGLKVLATDSLTDQSDHWKEPRIGLDSLAHLQYTPAAHAHAAQSLCELANEMAGGRIMGFGGGGYNRGNLAAAWCSVLDEFIRGSER